jgi:hypothetical protein
LLALLDHKGAASPKSANASFKLNPMKYDMSKCGRFQAKASPTSHLLSPRIVITEHVKLEQGFPDLNILSQLANVNSFRRSQQQKSVVHNSSFNSISTIESLKTSSSSGSSKEESENDEENLYAKVYLNKARGAAATDSSDEKFAKNTEEDAMEEEEEESLAKGFTSASKSIVNQSIDTIKESISNFKRKFSKSTATDEAKKCAEPTILAGKNQQEVDDE